MHENAKLKSNCSYFADALQCIKYGAPQFPTPGTVWHKKMWKVPTLFYSIFITRTIQAILRKLVLFYKAICKRKRKKGNHKNCSSPSPRFVMTKVHSCINWIIIVLTYIWPSLQNSFFPSELQRAHKTCFCENFHDKWTRHLGCSHFFFLSLTLPFTK